MGVISATVPGYADSHPDQLHQHHEQVAEFFAGSEDRHTNNWAVLACTSRFWFNYRHIANTLAIYRNIKRLGIPDSNIILMLADDVACNPRNIFPATVYANPNRQLDLYGDSVEVDYSGYEVTVENFLRTLTDASSNVLIYLTGHGGNEFLKFQDNEELSAFDVADAVEQMWEKRRYNRLLFMIDTCQANTMYSQFYSPNIIATGSSDLGENSLSHDSDYDIGVAIIDSFTHFVLGYLEEMNKTSQLNLQQLLFDAYDPVVIRSNAGVSTHLSPKSPREILLTDFFGGVARVEVSSRSSPDSEASARGWTPDKADGSRRGAQHRQFKVLHDRTPQTLEGLARRDSGMQAVGILFGAVVLTGAAWFVYSHRY
ncbi:hypothetical protein CspeluHIS016_0703390 [Cutaneotrichosporon spelunceum]|uniref:GPI-anchor transamidase n=1 Tax=Cutaneotrichosporon spelunceum TaxID=1672016 RepID=A0AAD3TYR4_9TREE|nr:hypothetical protein CspeluHIS016_0703390 [Cutaneotrichosporon spelunceum]